MTFFDGRNRPITAKNALRNAKKGLKVYIEESGNIYTLTLKKVLEYGIPREALIIEAIEREPLPLPFIIEARALERYPLPLSTSETAQANGGGEAAR